tara:strand:- start:330 stop:452 length:123 start_codon:yes stop_codon:yes gene_type:complete
VHASFSRKTKLKPQREGKEPKVQTFLTVNQTPILLADWFE